MINREEFENIPSIAERLKIGDVYWSESTQTYKPKGGTYRRSTFINGAWNMYQEMHKKVAGSEEKPKDKDSVMNKAVDMARDYGTAFVQLKINTANEIEYKNIDYGNVILRKTED